MSTIETLRIPDIGGTSKVDVIEILVKPGDRIEKDTPLVTLESDKASMEIPAERAGVIESLVIKLGDKVSEGDAILTLRVEGDNAATEVDVKEKSIDTPITAPATATSSSVTIETPARASKPSSVTTPSGIVFAGPGIRRFARELGVDLAAVKGTGFKSRITKMDIQAFVKAALAEKSAGEGFSIAPMPAIDFSVFGEIETVPLSKIKRLTGAYTHRSWVTIPHVTQFDEADITELEAFRKAETANITGYKLTLLAFVCKAITKALHMYPQFNASLDSSGMQLIYKKYMNIGVAVETPNGLLVAVIKNADKLPVLDIARVMSELSAKAREKGLSPQDMSGGSFTVSSLGGIGGTAFTPIVNAPEVAILGLSRSVIKPVYKDGNFEPRLMLPLSLSYDHRVIDGAEAARFTRFIAECLGDIRRVLL